MQTDLEREAAEHLSWMSRALKRWLRSVESDCVETSDLSDYEITNYSTTNLDWTSSVNDLTPLGRECLRQLSQQDAAQ